MPRYLHWRECSDRMLRRSFDILIAIVLLIACAPILLLAAAAILVLSGRPIIFRQQRAGYRGKQFGMLKLRSMRQNADEILERHLSSDPSALEEWGRDLRLDRDPRHIRFIGRA